MDPVQSISLMLGAAWASGINLYAAILVLGYMGMTGYVQLPPELQILSDPLVMLAAGLMYAVEFFADKTPGVDTGWDAIHTFIRIPAGALLAAGAASGIEVGAAGELAAGLVGGLFAAEGHLIKTGSRIMINTSPEPVSNWTASVAEDIAVVGGLWAALTYPWAFLALLPAFVVFTAWALPRLWRAVKGVFQRIGRWFRGERPAGSPEDAGGKRADVLRALYHDASKDQR